MNGRRSRRSEGFFGLVAIGNETSAQVDEDVRGTAVAGVVDLGDILELIDDGLDEGAFAQQQLVGGQIVALTRISLQLGSPILEVFMIAGHSLLVKR